MLKQNLCQLQNLFFTIGNGGLSISEFLEKIDLVNFADPSGITSDKSNGYDDESQQMGQTGQQQPPEKQSNTSHADGSKVRLNCSLMNTRMV